MADSAGGKEVGRISIRVVPDLKGFREKIRAELAAIEAGEHKVKVEAEVKGAKAKTEMRAILDELKLMAAKDIEIKAKVNESSFSRVKSAFSNLFKNNGDGAGSGLVGSIGDIRAFGIGLPGLLAIAALIPPAISLVSGALLTLPAIAAGVAVPLGVVALGLDGIKKAAENAGLLGVGKKGKTALGEQLKEIQTAVSSTFESKLTPVFQQLDTLVGPLKDSLPSVAGGISDIAAAIVQSVTSADGLDGIKTTVSSIGTALTNSAPGAKSFTSAIGQLTSEVASKFPAVGTALSRIGDQFSGWINKITAKNPATGVSQLDTALGTLKDTLAPVGGAIGDLLRKGFERLTDPAFAAGMKEFTTDLRSLANVSFDGLADSFSKIMGYIKGFKDEWNKLPQGLRDFILGKFLDKPKPEIKSDNGPHQYVPPSDAPGRGLGGLFDQPAADTKNSMQALIATIQGKFIELWANLKIQAAQTAVDIGNAFGGIGIAFDTLKGVVAAKFGEIVQSVVQGGFNVAIGLANAWASLPGVASNAFNGLRGVAVGALAGLVSDVIQKGVEIAAEVASWGGKIASAASNIAHALDGIGGQMIAGFLNGFRSAAANAVVEVGEWAGKIAAAARNALGIHSPSKVFAEIGGYTAQGFTDGLNGSKDQVIQAATALAQSVSDAMKNGLDLSGFSDEIKQATAALDLQRKTLKVQEDGTTDKGQKKDLQNQMKQITNLKDQLGLQKDQIKAGDALNKNQDDMTKTMDKAMGDALSKSISAASGFATANLKQGEQDLGIGGGAITNGLDAGIGWATQALGKMASGLFSGGTTIQVNSVDEAMAAKQTLANKQALQYTGR